MDIERMYEVIEKLSETVKFEFDKGIENIDTCEMKEAVDMLKDISMALYYRTLTVAMEESSAEETMYMFDRYGDDRRFYNHYHYKDGKFAPKGSGTRRGYEEPPYYHMMPEYEMSVSDYKTHSPEYWRDIDRLSGKLYFSEPMKGAASISEPNRTGTADMRNTESRYDRAKRMYTETKEMHKANTPDDKAITLKEGEKLLNVIFDELSEITKDTSPEMKNLVKTKGMAYLQKIQ